MSPLVVAPASSAPTLAAASKPGHTYLKHDRLFSCNLKKKEQRARTAVDALLFPSPAPAARSVGQGGGLTGAQSPGSGAGAGEGLLESSLGAGGGEGPVDRARPALGPSGARAKAQL